MITRMLVIVGLLIAAATMVSAQGALPTPGSFTVQSNPPGAEVVLDGDVRASGITPTTFEQTLVGGYTVHVKKYLYETYKTKVFIDPVKTMTLDVKLEPKTRTKAMARSLFIPGWGQRYAERKTKGMMYTLGAAASVAGYFVADNHFDNKYEEFKERKRLYEVASLNGTSPDILAVLASDAQTAQSDAADAENLRRVSIGAVVGVWALNLLDLIFFFPEESGSISVKGLSLTPAARPGTLGIVLSRGF